MKQTDLFLKTKKQALKDDTSLNSQLLYRAGYIDKTMAGAYALLPLGLQLHNNICNIIRKEINLLNAQELKLNILTPKENWVKTDRWDNFDALFRFKSSYGSSFALGATHEEIITPLAKDFIKSYKDLPFALYQIQTKLRDEARPKGGMLRLREFTMKDLYSFHENRQDLDKYYEKVKKAYLKIFKQLKLKVYAVEASGETFSNLSHEFLTPLEIGEDEILVCEKDETHFCKKSDHGEIQTCPVCKSNIKKIKVAELAHIFKLETKFSKAFDVNYLDKQGKQNLVYMGCYGIGISRIIGILAEKFADDKGLSFPNSVAPFSIHLVPLYTKEAKVNKKIQDQILKIYDKLVKSNISVLYDNREVSNSIKLVESDLIGIPYRIVISEKTLENNSFEFKERNKKTAKIIPLKNFNEKLIK